MAEALLRGEEEALVRKAIEQAKAKERSVHLNLAVVDGSHDALDALKAVIDAVSIGQIAPREDEVLVSALAT